MLRLRILLVFLVALISAPTFGQKSEASKKERYTISGYVKESETGESMFSANVVVKELQSGTSTNNYGFYSLTLEKGVYNVSISFLGFATLDTTLTLDRDIRLNASLRPIGFETQTFEFVEDRGAENTEDAQMGAVELDIESIKQLPAFLGEVDLMKTLQLLPGVQSGGEGQTGLYVRGGGPDQNLILLDEAVVYNASHLFGFFSIFNSDAVKSVELIKGGMPANYGGRLASVLDVSMKEGNSKKFAASGGLGLISSRLTLEGPIKKDTSSFIISGRRTYIDVLAEPFINDSSAFAGSGYYFYDLNGKVNYRLSDKDRLFLSSYFGRDVFTFNNNDNDFKVRVPWGNTTVSARWNHLFSDKLFLNSTVIFSDYQFEFQAEQNDFEFKLFSGIRDWNAKFDFNYFPSIRHNIKFGLNYTWHTFTPSSVSASVGDTEFNAGEIKQQLAHEAALYINDEFDLTDRIRINGGLRYSIFRFVGPFDRFVQSNVGTITDTIRYSAGEEIATYSGLEPRLTLRYRLNERSSVKAAYSLNYQYVHLATLSGVSLPTDVWVPSSDIVKPQRSIQYAAGYFQNFLNNRFEASVEGYYKDMINLIEYEEGALPEDDIGNNADNNFTFGTGYSYGVEFFLKKRTGPITGWVGYTWSVTNRNFAEINEGREFPATYDRRNDLSLVLAYKLNKRWSFGGTFVYATGNTLTLPVARYVIEGRVVNEYTDRNGFRMVPYHRADISATLHGPEEKRFHWDLVFSVFNVYNRANPYFIYFDNQGSVSQGTLDLQAYQVSIFPVLPSVTYNFKW